jgi:hypothetical protein
MSLTLHIILILLLVVACYQDWKFRAIYWFIFPLIAMDALLIFFIQQWNWKVLGLNLIFVIAVMMLLFLYVSAREKKWTNLFENHFGMGDVLFFLAITPLFNSTNYMLFFISGMIFSATLHGLVNLRKTSKTIPLAGYLSLYLVALKGFGWWLQDDLFYKNWLV